MKSDMEPQSFVFWVINYHKEMKICVFTPEACLLNLFHISLRQNSAIKSHDGRNEFTKGIIALPVGHL